MSASPSTSRRTLHTVRGRESVRFTPDAAICELDFRAYPNEPTIAAVGSALSLTDASVAEHPVSALVSADGAAAGAPGTLIRLPLSQCLQSGQSVDAELGFTVTLGRDADERVGYSPATGTAWFGSAFPLLSWVRGQGWSNDPAVAMNGETAVSVEFQLVDLAVTAPDGDQVSGSARPDRPTRDHHPPLHGRVGARRSGRRRPEQANSG